MWIFMFIFHIIFFEDIKRLDQSSKVVYQLEQSSSIGYEGGERTRVDNKISFMV